MTISTFYPNADGAGGATSCDGWLKYFISDYEGFLWGTALAASTATHAYTDGTTISETYQSRSSNDTNKYKLMGRNFMLYDTSALPDGDIISAATISLTGKNKADGFNESTTICLTNPASNTGIVLADWDKSGPEISQVHQSADIVVAGMASDSTTPTVFVLNAAGIASISKTGITKFGTSLLADIDRVTPTWGNDLHQQMNWFSSVETEAADERPVLTVTHAAPPFVPRAIMF